MFIRHQIRASSSLGSSGGGFGWHATDQNPGPETSIFGDAVFRPYIISAL